MANIWEVINQNQDVVDYLLQNNLNSFSNSDKQFIVNNLCRPCPLMPNLINIKQDPSVSNNSYRAFNIHWYEKYSWLTGSLVRNKLFCWNCILFGEYVKHNSWNTLGYDNLKMLGRSVQRHANSKEHLHATLKLKLFRKKSTVSALLHTGYKEDAEKHNNLVRENREVMRRLIDVTIYLATQELVFNGCEEISKTLNFGNFKELAAILCKYDSKFNDSLNEPSLFRHFSETTVNDLISSINIIIADAIEAEIKQTACFSWQLDETVDASCFSQMSVIFKYVFQGNVVERFMGFFNVNESHRTEDLFQVLKTKFEKFDISNKLIGQTYDGALVTFDELNKLQTKVKEIAPQALFMHCYAHKLNLILQDATSKIKECRIFFGNLVGISSFFSKSSKITKVLDDVCHRVLPNRGIPYHSGARFNFKYKLIETILNNRDILIEVFETIINSEHFQTDHNTIREAVGLKSMLSDFTSLFLVQTFNLVFQHTDIIVSVTENKLSDIPYCIKIIESLLSTINKFKTDESYFTNIYQDVVDILGPPSKRIKTEFIEPSDEGSGHFRSIFKEILDLAICQIDIRFKNLKLLKNLSLLDNTKFKSYEALFPQSLFDLLISNYPKLFDKTKLHNELRILYSDPNLLDESATANFQSMLNFIYTNGLQEEFSEVYKLLSLILSLPVSSTPDQRSVLLKKIKKFCRNSVGNVHLNVSIMSIEKDFIKSLQKDKKFYEQVTDHFASQEVRDIELFFKPV